VDIHREHSQSANRVENIEAIPEEVGLVSFDDTPESAMETAEKRIVIRRAIANLPTRLRETFILHFYQELSHQEIAEQQEISYQNVCKRISQARAILVEELRGYFIGEYRTEPDLSVTSTSAATESAIEEIPNGNEGLDAIVGETVTFAVAVEEVESVVGESPTEVAISVLDEDESSFLESATSSNEPYPITKGDSLRQCLRLRSLIWPAVGILDLLYSQVREMQSLFERRWQVWMDTGGC
jgi:Sigma-70, region 4